MVPVMVTERRAVADMADMGSAVGGAAMKRRGGTGMVGQAAKLGTAIGDMQTQVDGLQKNLETPEDDQGSARRLSRSLGSPFGG